MTRHVPTPPGGVPALELEILRLEARIRTLTAASDGQCAACLEVGVERGAAAERVAIDEMLCAEAHGLAAKAYVAGMGGDKDNAERGEIASAVLRKVIEMICERGAHLAPARGEGEP